MTFITKKAFNRRTILRGLGTAFALPLLDSMVPSLTAFDKTAAAPVNRFGAVYTPNGRVMKNWTPLVDGEKFEFTPTLQPLAPYRDKLLVLSGLNRRLPENHVVGVHCSASTGFLTDSLPTPAEGTNLYAGISADQIAAKHLGHYTQLASLEVSLQPGDLGGTSETGFSKAYVNTMSWSSATTPLPMESNPRAVFERLFGDTGSTDPAVRMARLQQERSILDSITEVVADLGRELGQKDRLKLVQYMEAVRDVERHIQKTEEQNEKELPLIEHPAGIPVNFSEHARLMYDLCVLAFQADLTRVITFMVGHELSGQTYPEIGVADAHHAISHHQGNPVNLEKLSKIDAYNVSLFAHFIEKLNSTPDGDGSLLDHGMILFGAGMSDGNLHDPKNLPIALLGNGCGQLKGGRHLRYKETPLANLHVTLLNKLGVHVDSIGDSQGELDLSA